MALQLSTTECMGGIGKKLVCLGENITGSVISYSSMLASYYGGMDEGPSTRHHQESSFKSSKAIKGYTWSEYFLHDPRSRSDSLPTEHQERPGVSARQTRAVPPSGAASSSVCALGSAMVVYPRLVCATFDRLGGPRQLRWKDRRCVCTRCVRSSHRL